MMLGITATSCKSYVSLSNCEGNKLTGSRGRVFALDIFNTGFAADTLSKDAGSRYRDMVLRLGGSQPEIDVLTRYLGREPSTRPYFEYLGIEPRDSKPIF